MKKVLLLVSVVLFSLSISACNQASGPSSSNQQNETNVEEGQEQGHEDNNVQQPSGYNLKTGSDFYSSIAEIVGQNSPKHFMPSSTAPSQQVTVGYLDLDNKDVPIWYDEDTETVYFYADGVTTSGGTKKLILNEDSSGMFRDMSSLESIDVSKFDTSNVVEMGNMFDGCKKLVSLNLSNFDTSKVVLMAEMFRNCTSLENLDLSSFNTSNVVSMVSMFKECENLIQLNISSFNTKNVHHMGAMFAGCKKLQKLDVTGFNTSNVEDMSSMFSQCQSLKSLDVSKFDTSNVDHISGMFSCCEQLEAIDLSNFNTSKVTEMTSMFSDCTKLQNINLSNFVLNENVNDLSMLFYNCTNLKEIDISGFNTSNVTEMLYMFSDCSNLEKILVSDNFVLTKITNKGFPMFENCTKLKGGAGTTFSSQNISAQYAHIDEGETNPGYFTRKTNNN